MEQISTTGNVTYLQQDQLHSTRLLTDSSGNVAATYNYGPFGKVTAHAGTATTALLFAGQYLDSESGLYYLRNRYYDPSTGQFLTRDPLEPVTQVPYGYANDNPLNQTDPLGLWGWNPFQDIGQAWHDTLGQHWRGTLEVAGAIAGTVALASGVGELGIGAYAAATGAETVFGVSTGTAAAALGTAGTVASAAGALADLPGCLLGHGFNVSCLGAIGNALGGGLGYLGDLVAGDAVDITRVLDGLLRTGAISASAFTLFWDLFNPFAEEYVKCAY